MPTISGTVLDDTGAAVAGRTVRAYRRDTGALLGAVRTADGASDSSVVALLYLDGAEGATTFYDATGKTWTATGAAVISRAQSVFGGGALFVPNSDGNFIAAGTSADWAFGTGDFTVELWVRIAAIPATLFDSPVGNWGASTGWCFFVQPTGVLSFFTNGTSLASAAGVVAANTWHHIAVCRASGTLRIFVDGVQVASAANTENLTRSDFCRVGCNAVSTDSFNGWIDMVRISKGLARYTAGFAVPSVPFAATPISSAAGTFAIQTAHAGECNVICLDDVGGTTYNDLILRTTPV
jgi:hypothetical protein